MAREIKFRAWDAVHKRMYAPKDIGVLLKNVKDDNVWKFMQFTGLLDRNANPIYEGDIVKTAGGTIYSIHSRPGLFTICKDGDPEWQIANQGLLHHESDLRLEVIGNIYENADLYFKSP